MTRGVPSLDACPRPVMWRDLRGFGNCAPTIPSCLLRPVGTHCIAVPSSSQPWAARSSTSAMSWNSWTPRRTAYRHLRPRLRHTLHPRARVHLLPNAVARFLDTPPSDQVNSCGGMPGQQQKEPRKRHNTPLIERAASSETVASPAQRLSDVAVYRRFQRRPRPIARTCVELQIATPVAAAPDVDRGTPEEETGNPSRSTPSSGRPTPVSRQ